MLINKKRIDAKGGIPSVSVYLSRMIGYFFKLKRVFLSLREFVQIKTFNFPHPFERRKAVFCRFISPNAFFPEEQVDIWLKKLPRQGQIFHLQGSNISLLVIRQIPQGTEESHVLDAGQSPSFFSSEKQGLRIGEAEALFEVIEYRNNCFF